MPRQQIKNPVKHHVIKMLALTKIGGGTQLVLNAGKVAKILGFSNRMPAVCNALKEDSRVIKTCPSNQSSTMNYEFII